MLLLRLPGIMHVPGWDSSWHTEGMGFVEP